MVDRNLILRKLAELEEYLEQVGEFKSVTCEDYCKDWKTQRIVERTLQLMIELCVDICVVIAQMQPDDRLVISDIAWEVGFAHDLHLSTIVVSEEKFEQGPIAASPLLEAIRNEGVAA